MWELFVLFDIICADLKGEDLTIKLVLG